MKQSKTLILLAVVGAVLVLGVAYAAISNITLQVNGNVVATASEGNFKVAFTSATKTEGTGTCTPVIDSDDTKALMNVSGLSKQGDSITAEFVITNSSETLGAELNTPTVAWAEDGYFNVTANLDKETLGVASATDTTDEATLTVKVELIKTPISGDVEDVITIDVDAVPVNP